LRRFILFAIIIMAAVAGVLGCNLSGDATLAPVEPTVTSEPNSGGATLAPIVTVTHRGGSDATEVSPTATPLCGADQSQPQARYDVNALIDFDTHSANVTLKATYRNDDDKPLDQIVLNVESNRKPDVFTLTRLDTESSVGVDRFTLTGPRLEIALKSPLQTHCEATFTLGFKVQPGAIVQSFVANTGYLGYSPRQLNFSEWLPEFAPMRGGKPYTPDVWPIGEITESLRANFTATVRIKSVAPNANQIDVIGAGTVEHPESDTWRFTIDGARTFTLSAGLGIQRLSTTATDATTNAQIPIDLYYFPTSANVPTPAGTDTPEARAVSSAQHALDTAKAALERFSKVYGAYPYTRLVVVQGDFPDGMEFSGLVYVSLQWFTMYEGRPDTWLTLITAHEVSHQWWYGLVGNNQAFDPFLDEGLALYSELIFLEAQYPKLVNWWWDFRVRAYGPSGSVDSTIYDFKGLRPYINAVYLRGALMLQEIRTAIGDDAFFVWLQHYRTTQQGKVATLRDLWLAMSGDDYTKIAPIRAKYLHTADPLTAAGVVNSGGTSGSPTGSPAIQSTGQATEPCCG
jgi:hypothetical protein